MAHATRFSAASFVFFHPSIHLSIWFSTRSSETQSIHASTVRSLSAIQSLDVLAIPFPSAFSRNPATMMRLFKRLVLDRHVHRHLALASSLSTSSLTYMLCFHHPSASHHPQISRLRGLGDHRLRRLSSTPFYTSTGPLHPDPSRAHEHRHRRRFSRVSTSGSFVRWSWRPRLTLFLCPHRQTTFANVIRLSSLAPRA